MANRNVALLMHEVKFDRYRLLGLVPGTRRLRTRNGQVIPSR
jgi:hypothetical protein